MPDKQTHFKLSNGYQIPQLGLGVWQASQDEARSAVRAAIEMGYRHVDTAAVYENEEGVGQGLRESGVPREQIFVTTKVWNDSHGETLTRAAVEASLKRLDVEYVDLLLIHWPVPSKDKYVETWQTLMEIQREGKARSIGVSNFNRDHLERLISETGFAPVLNQIELHPFFNQKQLRDDHKALDILTQSWSPLGQGSALSDPVILKIAEKYEKSAAQVIIRWHVELGLIAIPKSVTAARIRENLDVFDFSLDASDLAAIAGLHSGKRLGPDPMELT
ncbi:aldo/keto reductase [Pseudomonas matsuisoli]|uniref:Oxidoreductase n=1 Tax=Pseudomonas matsuisoli TaxID=1515666 RepID=A0A917UYA1_9PSED|nr:aldo/keto reductase [Pseudomonas matsuisoli]GGJ94759.1 putative oxidoreductase [Pseudomonas matsuisoli]